MLLGVLLSVVLRANGVVSACVGKCGPLSQISVIKRCVKEPEEGLKACE
jgi:hypothetical protein